MIKYSGFLWLLLVLEAHFSYQCASEYPSYFAGVVDFSISQDVEESYNRMTKIIESEEAKYLDILVFPEVAPDIDAVKTFVPDPEQRIAPCDMPNFANFLVEVSCSARSRRTYVVLNVLEKVESDPCASPKKEKVYNTNVVFNRNGVVIARYRKSHLYRGEWHSTNVLDSPEISVFDTDFGVTFGIFTGWDILFYEPAMTLVKVNKIMDIICPMKWFSELPFLTSIQIQEGWAIANDVNLLVSSTSGSGIYGGKLGRLNSIISEKPTTRLVTTHVPKSNLRHSCYYNQLKTNRGLTHSPNPQLETPRISKMPLMRDYNVDLFETLSLSKEFIDVRETVCHGLFCCRFNIRRKLLRRNCSDHATYSYRLAAYNGNQVTFQHADHADLSICALLACTTDELWSCGRIFPENRLVGNKYYFSDLQVAGMFKNEDRRLIMPSTVDAMMMPLHTSDYKMKEEPASGDSRYTYAYISLTSPKADILTFGLIANHYKEQKATHNLGNCLYTQQSNEIKAKSFNSTFSSSKSPCKIKRRN